MSTSQETRGEDTYRVDTLTQTGLIVAVVISVVVIGLSLIAALIAGPAYMGNTIPANSTVTPFGSYELSFTNLTKANQYLFINVDLPIAAGLDPTFTLDVFVLTAPTPLPWYSNGTGYTLTDSFFFKNSAAGGKTALHCPKSGTVCTVPIFAETFLTQGSYTIILYSPSNYLSNAMLYIQTLDTGVYKLEFVLSYGFGLVSAIVLFYLTFGPPGLFATVPDLTRFARLILAATVVEAFWPRALGRGSVLVAYIAYLVGNARFAVVLAFWTWFPAKMRTRGDAPIGKLETAYIGFTTLACFVFLSCELADMVVVDNQPIILAALNGFITRSVVSTVLAFACLFGALAQMCACRVYAGAFPETAHLAASVSSLSIIFIVAAIALHIIGEIGPFPVSSGATAFFIAIKHLYSWSLCYCLSPAN